MQALSRYGSLNCCLPHLSRYSRIIKNNTVVNHIIVRTLNVRMSTYTEDAIFGSLIPLGSDSGIQLFGIWFSFEMLTFRIQHLLTMFVMHNSWYFISEALTSTSNARPFADSKWSSCSMIDMSRFLQWS